MGLVLAVVALLLLVALASYHPTDASFLHQTTAADAVRNLIGPVGSQIAAAGFGSLGLAVLLVPVLLAVWLLDRFRRRDLRLVPSPANGPALAGLDAPYGRAFGPCFRDPA